MAHYDITLEERDMTGQWSRNLRSGQAENVGDFRAASMTEGPKRGEETRVTEEVAQSEKESERGGRILSSGKRRHGNERTDGAACWAGNCNWRGNLFTFN